jgi:hypothetical protein
MSSSLADMLTLVEADVPERLISHHTFASLMSMCGLLPMDISSGFGFESRLAEKSAKVDLIVRVPAPGGLNILAGNNPSCRLPDNFFQEATLARLRSLALSWQTWPKSLREGVSAAWLEFDADQFARPVPTPSLLFLQFGKPDCSRECCGQIARTAYSIVRGHAIESELVRALDMCLNRVPDHALVLQAGMGISRPTRAMRLVLDGLAQRDMLSYLSSIGWTGNQRELEFLLLDLGRYIPQFNLDIDLLASVCPKIGIECSFGRVERSAMDLTWTDFLHLIKGKGWCLPEKSDGLLEWPGQKLFQAGNESWPWVVERFLNHLKINYDPVSGMEAKAYFGLVWRRASTAVGEAHKGPKPTIC